MTALQKLDSPHWRSRRTHKGQGQWRFDLDVPYPVPKRFQSSVRGSNEPMAELPFSTGCTKWRITNIHYNCMPIPKICLDSIDTARQKCEGSTQWIYHQHYLVARAAGVQKSVKVINWINVTTKNAASCSLLPAAFCLPDSRRTHNCLHRIHSVLLLTHRFATLLLCNFDYLHKGNEASAFATYSKMRQQDAWKMRVSDESVLLLCKVTGTAKKSNLLILLGSKIHFVRAAADKL